MIAGLRRVGRMIEGIWQVGGSVTLPHGQTSQEAFARLDPLFRQTGTRSDRTDDTLSFTKKDQAAQDRMAVFDGGMLRIERDMATPVLRYRLTSRFLLFCFLAPLMFLAFAQLTIVVARHEAAEKKAAAARPGAAAEAKKKAEKENIVWPQSPVDKALGMPPPEKKKKKDDDGPKPTAAYVFAAIFAALYAVGRVWEARRINALFRQRLLET